ncbi:YidC/Oxa1 family membrane protein insertase [Microterricola viridarii]|uniref:Membrane protein insertase YidC n=1 Tax=Microterricola viridarii TaxID=412690 RepID=A0A1H1UTC4_9MICO|nr:YidC/Oxa1 family membrane protein insertase [Microterricola viridarii]SDS75792.1 YidC/Oxa1 family membrane protein insertase [Microterricola viridarii]
MDLYAFAPIAALLELASTAVNGLAALFAPIPGAPAMALAVVALTILVRVALIPVGMAQARAELTRRRLAPKLQALQRRHTGSPEKLQRATMELYAEEKTSPFAGMLPALAQAPVLSLVYGLFILPTINGHPNALLSETLFGVPLGTSFLSLLNSGSFWPGAAVFLGLLAVIAAVALTSRRVMLAQQAQSGAEMPAAMARVSGVLSWMPLITVVFAAIVPLAAAIYLTVTTTWTLGERAVLRRRAEAREQRS